MTEESIKQNILKEVYDAFVAGCGEAPIKESGKAAYLSFYSGQFEKHQKEVTEKWPERREAVIKKVRLVGKQTATNARNREEAAAIEPDDFHAARKSIQESNWTGWC